MRIKILLIAVLVFFVGCNPEPPQGATTDTGRGYNVKVVDSCEYIEYDAGFGQMRVYSLTHKGDCKNPIHKCGSENATGTHEIIRVR
jgi:hypothetical protein